MQNHSDATVEYLRTLAKKQKNIMMPLEYIFTSTQKEETKRL